MNALKTDYRDALFEGKRLYRIAAADDGKSTIDDMTVYLQQGDLFGANDINTTNAAVNALQGLLRVVLPVGAWSQVFPYTQTVSVAGLQDTDNPIPVLIVTGTSEAAIKAQRKAFGLLYKGTTGNNSFTVYALKRPAVDITIGLKGR